MSPDLRPGVTVVLPTHQGAARIGPALDSLARQTLPPQEFETVVVVNGPDDGTTEVVRSFAAAHPRLTVRVVRIAEAGLGRAINLGVAAARYEYVTILDDDDRLGPDLLLGLWRRAAPGLVVQGYLAEVDDSGAPPELETYVNVSIVGAAGRTVPPAGAPAALSFNVAKLVWTPHARAVPRRRDLRLGTDVDFWHRVTDRFGLQVHVVDVEAHAVYLRHCRPDSHSRPARQDWETSVGTRLDLVAALTPLGLATGRPVQQVSRAAMHTYARAVGRWLRERPDEHGRLVAEVERRDLPRFLWRSLNRDRARDLVVAGDRPLVGPSRVAVDVLTTREHGALSDPAALRPWVGDVEVLPVRDLTGWAGVTAFSDAGLATVARWTDLRGGPYRTVRTTSAAPAAVALAALITLQDPSTRWVHDAPSGSRPRSRRGAPSPVAHRVAALMAERGLEPVEPSGSAGRWSRRLVQALAEPGSAAGRVA